MINSLVKFYTHLYTKTTYNKRKGRDIINASLMVKPIIYNICNDHKVETIFDFGCGPADHWEIMGPKIKPKKVMLYDPAIDKYSIMPPEDMKFDLTMCVDVLEHIPEEEIDEILYHTFWRTKDVMFFSIALTKAKQILPNGQNAHVTIKDKKWWYEKIDRFYGLYPYLTVYIQFGSETKIFRLKGKSRAIISVANLIKKSRKDGELKS